MIKSKTQGSIHLKKSDKYNALSNIKFEASESNFTCFFCKKKLFSKTIYDIVCSNCGSEWAEKMSSKKLRVYDAT
tara:strand:+ start:9969 stop:10193 length:225 start_codon:yes stop_codon:yes gene_type:complete